MNIWMLFCFFAAAVADSYDGESENLNGVNKVLEFDHRPIFPFDAFGLGYENFLRSGYPPLLSAMNKFFAPSPKFESHESAEVIEADRKTESEQSSSGSDQIKESNSDDKKKRIQTGSTISESSEVKDRSISSKSKTMSESGETISVSESKMDSTASSSKREKVVPSTSTTFESSKEKNKSISSDSDDSISSKSNSASKSKILASEEPESSSKEISASISSSLSSDRRSVSAEYDEKKGSQSESDSEKSSVEKKETIETSDISSGGSVFLPSTLDRKESETEVYSGTNENTEKITGEITIVSSDGSVIDSTSKEQSSSDFLIESQCVLEDDLTPYEEEHNFKVPNYDTESELMFRKSEATNKEFSGLGHYLRIPSVRKHLEDSYNKLGEMKKSLRKKQSVISDINQIIDNLQLLCEMICQVVPEEYLVSNAE